MKKLAMMTVKGIIGLVPKPVRNKLKSNHKLTEFYSRSLQRSGLFYGFPSQKKLMALYSFFLKHQEAEIERKVAAIPNVDEMFLVIVGCKNISRTLDNLKLLGVSKRNIKVVTKERDIQGLTGVTSISAACASIPERNQIVFINSGDTLHPKALTLFSLHGSSAGIAYSDTDKANKKKQNDSPHFLPSWNPDLQFSTAYVSTGVVCSSSVLNKATIKSSTIAGMISELWLLDSSISIKHIPYTLIHRSDDAIVTRKSLEDVGSALRALSNAASNYDETLQINNIQWPVVEQPLISLIIPTKNGKDLVRACIDSILEKTVYQNYEILLIDNGSDDSESLSYFSELERHPKIRVLRYPGEFNYSAINNFGVQYAKGSLIGLINNDIEVIKPSWLTTMIGHALREDIGCVGAKLLYSDGRIQHAGVVLGYGGGAGHAHKYFPRYHPGYIKRLIATQNYSAVTAACLVVKKSLFHKVGGLNEKDLAVAFNDVDFCLRVKETGVRNIYCAEAELYHHESVSRGLDHAPEKAARFNKELAYLRTNWVSYIKSDPAYSPNLTLKRENFSVKEKEEFVFR
ncbi:glycosyltransferase family 2 protein [Alteromonas australica]|uniref:glycosyltransferase family 2 protein n=1 Tax=Alteromonas australica TaxID=589873 RepID=UPI0023528F78|nr:glycosyltransferase family 2 protein [Alteromonas australica]|tara:strand:- start:284 stop:1999 length:1716 start_codon:yes stop_codon:yes gene_type:complete